MFDKKEEFTADPKHEGIVPTGNGPELPVPPSGQITDQETMKKAAGKPATKSKTKAPAKEKPAPKAEPAEKAKPTYDRNAPEERAHRHLSGNDERKPKPIPYEGNGPELAVPPSGQIMDLATMEKAAGHIRKESEINKPLDQMNEADMEVWLSNSKDQKQWDERAMKVKQHNGGVLPGRVQQRLQGGVDPLFTPKH